MPSYDEDRLTADEEKLLVQLVDVKEKDERRQTLTRLKNLLIASQRSKWVFGRANLLDHLNEFLHEYSGKDDAELLSETFDCLASLSKISGDETFSPVKSLRQTFVQLSSNVESERFVQSALRFLRSLAERAKDSFVDLPIDAFDLLRHLLTSSSSRPNQTLVIEILSSISIDPSRIEDFAERVHQILRENVSLVK